MSIAIKDGQGATLAQVEATAKAIRTTSLPIEHLAWQSIGAQSGALTGVAANGPVFSFRNASANPVLIRRVGVGFVCTTGFTAGQAISYGLTIARSFSASDSGGTALAFTGNNAKHRTSDNTPTSTDCRISTTAALTAGTRTLDTNTLSTIGGYALTTTVGTIIAPAIDNLFNCYSPGDEPIVLAQNEGIVITNVVAMGAAGVGTFFANMSFAELTVGTF